MAARQVEAAHLVVANGDSHHRIDALRIFAQRLAIGFERKGDITERKLGMAFGDTETDRLLAGRQRALDRPDVKVAAAARHCADRDRDT